MVRRIYRRTGGQLPIIAAGGIFTGGDVLAAIAAGATLVQAYTGFIYEGPGMARRAKQELVELLDRRGIASVDEVRGGESGGE